MSIFSKFFSLSHRVENKIASSKIADYIVKHIPRNESITVIDLGAHSGGFTEELSLYYNISAAVMVEPIPELAEIIKNKFPENNHRVFQNAVSDKDDLSIDFFVNEFAETSSLLKIKTEMQELSDVNTKLIKTLTVFTKRLDTIFSESGLKFINLLKIDVQGVEHLVINGGKIALMQTKYVWTELSFKKLYEGSSVFHEVVDLMEDNDFILLELSPGHRSPLGELLQVDALFVNKKMI